MKETYCIFPGCGVEIPAGRVIHKCDEHIALGELAARSPNRIGVVGYCVLCGERSTPALCDNCRPVIRLIVPGRHYYIDSHMGGVWEVECIGYDSGSNRYVYESRNDQYDFMNWRLTLGQIMNIVMVIRPLQHLHETDREYTERTGFDGPRAKVMYHD